MKATGIVRRVDDFGRIGIPKEVRRKFKIKEGDALELFIDEKDGEITFKLYETDFDRAQRIAKEAGKPCYELYYGETENYVVEMKRLYELKTQCEECMSHYCAYANNGECRYPLVHGKKPTITEYDGCIDFVYDAREHK